MEGSGCSSLASSSGLQGTKKKTQETPPDYSPSALRALPSPPSSTQPSFYHCLLNNFQGTSLFLEGWSREKWVCVSFITQSFLITHSNQFTKCTSAQGLLICSGNGTVTGTVRLWGGLQKGGSFYLALGDQDHDIVTKKNFRTHQGRDQESLLVKQCKERTVYT
jgi:hypothetical protein